MINIDRNATLVDVRSSGEYAKEHLPGAINIPLDEVFTRIEEFKLMRRPIIAYCRSGNRSAMAITILTRNGVTEAINGGGIADMWEVSGM